MLGKIHPGRPSGDDKRECARARLHIYELTCPACRARFWFALPLETRKEEVSEEHRRWEAQMRQDCSQGKHEGVEKVPPAGSP